jgi:hypothetical protein
MASSTTLANQEAAGGTMAQGGAAFVSSALCFEPRPLEDENLDALIAELNGFRNPPPSPAAWGTWDVLGLMVLVLGCWISLHLVLRVVVSLWQGLRWLKERWRRGDTPPLEEVVQPQAPATAPEAWRFNDPLRLAAQVADALHERRLLCLDASDASPEQARAFCRALVLAMRSDEERSGLRLVRDDSLG